MLGCKMTNVSCIPLQISSFKNVIAQNAYFSRDIY